MKNTKIYFYLLFLISCNILSAQIVPYEAVEFNDLTPLWYHVSIDSTIIDHIKYDGMTHLNLARSYNYKPIITDDYLIVGTNTLIEDQLQGGLIENIDIRTGQTNWTNHYDLRNNDRQEFIEYLEINNSHTIEVVTARRLKEYDKNEIGFMYILGGDSSVISTHSYDIETGIKIDHRFPDSTDYNALRIIHSLNNQRILFPKKNEGYQYIKYIHSFPYLSYVQIDVDSEGKEVNIFTDSITFDQDFSKVGLGGQSTSRAMYKISVDSLVCLEYLYKKDSSEFDQQTKISLYNAKLEKISSITDIGIYFESQYRIIGIRTANNNFIHLYGLIKGPTRFAPDTVVETILNWDGSLKKQFIPARMANISSSSVYEPLYLDNEDKFLLVALSSDLGSLDFLRSSDDGSFELLRSFSFTNKNQIIVPQFLEQLPNGDILMKGYHRHRKSDGTFEGGWHTWMRIKASDIGLMTSSEDYASIPNVYHKVYPNPSSGELNIELLDNINSGSIKVYNQEGKDVFTGQLIRGINQYQLGFLNKGIYTYSIFDKYNENIGFGKWIKQ